MFFYIFYNFLFPNLFLYYFKNVFILIKHKITKNRGTESWYSPSIFSSYFSLFSFFLSWQGRKKRRMNKLDPIPSSDTWRKYIFTIISPTIVFFITFGKWLKIMIASANWPVITFNPFQLRSLAVFLFLSLC